MYTFYKSKNIDETVRELLNAYVKWCGFILGRNVNRIQKTHFFAEGDYSKAMQEHARMENAYKFLKEIAGCPKKYLYSGKDITYKDVDQPVSIYDKLKPILRMPFDRDGGDILLTLSRDIATHINYGKDVNGIWVYDASKGLDSNALSIMKMNKTVQLWNESFLGASIKDIIVPSSMYAVDFQQVR